MATKKPIDWKQFDKLCALQCTKLEIAAFFDMSDDTLSRRVREEFDCSFAELFKEKRKKGKAALRRMQWQLAEKGNCSMLIWLGKNYLGQSDKLEQNVTNEIPSIEFVKDTKE